MLSWLRLRLGGRTRSLFLIKVPKIRCSTVMEPWVSWISDTCARENEALTRALQISLSDDHSASSSAEARLKVRRVRESLSSRAAKLFCSFFLLLLLNAGIVLFIIWLNLHPHRPCFHVSSFSVPGLSPGAGPAFSFDVSDRNLNENIGIFYGVVAGSIFYRNDRIGSQPELAGPFYQPPKNTTMIHGDVAGAALSLDELAADLQSGRVGFRLELVSTSQFKVSTWDSHRHPLHVSCDVEMCSDGALLEASKNRRCSIYFF